MIMHLIKSLLIDSIINHFCRFVNGPFNILYQFQETFRFKILAAGITKTTPNNSLPLQFIAKDGLSVQILNQVSCLLDSLLSNLTSIKSQCAIRFLIIIVSKSLYAMDHNNAFTHIPDFQSLTNYTF